MLQLDFGDRRPVYEQIKDKIKNLIIMGVLTENEKIPSVRELAASLTINPNTIQKAYKDLENEGYIYSQKARGSFVAPQKKTACERDTDNLFETLTSVVRELKFLGHGKEELAEIIDKLYKEDKQ
jgi:GntR family transcriptional regulator